MLLDLKTVDESVGLPLAQSGSQGVDHGHVGAQEAEVLCQLYQRLGTTLLPKLRGEFAFVIYDSKTVGGPPLAFTPPPAPSSGAPAAWLWGHRAPGTL